MSKLLLFVFDKNYTYTFKTFQIFKISPVRPTEEQMEKVAYSDQKDATNVGELIFNI